MHYIAVATFPKDNRLMSELASRRRNYRYPPQFLNVQSYLDAQGGRAIVHFETDDAKAILRYTADWPEVAFDLFPVVPAENGWDTYLSPRSLTMAPVASSGS
jgi:hypothetical protein